MAAWEEERVSCGVFFFKGRTDYCILSIFRYMLQFSILTRGVYPFIQNHEVIINADKREYITKSVL